MAVYVKKYGRRTGGGGSGRKGYFPSNDLVDLISRGVSSNAVATLSPITSSTPKESYSFHSPGAVSGAIISGLTKAGYPPRKRDQRDTPVPDEDAPPPAPSYSGPISPTAPSYLNADLASHYGMDAATAYQEALANTAHQREVADLKAAGINPVLSARYGGASGVSGAQLLSSGSSGSSGSSRSAEETDDFSSLIGGMVSLFTGSSARGNAAEKIFHSVQNIFSSSSAKDLFSRA